MRVFGVGVVHKINYVSAIRCVNPSSYSAVSTPVGEFTRLELAMSSRASDSLKRQPATEERVIREGWLQKEGGASKNKWQNRWFRLQGRTLFYFSKKEDSKPQGDIHLDDVEVISKIGEHSGKQHCISLVTTKGGNKKVYYLSAETEESLNEWHAVMQRGRVGDELSLRLIKYATAEVFLSQGIRISGDVHYNILSTISHRVTPDKKKRDSFGWFCDRPIALATVLNLFADYSWTPERIYRSTAVSGTDNSILPVIRVIFSKSPLGSGPPSKASSLTREGTLNRSTAGSVDGVSVSSQPVASPLPPGSKLLEGADDELIELMQEFDIPLTLLQVHSL